MRATNRGSLRTSRPDRPSRLPLGLALLAASFLGLLGPAQGQPAPEPGEGLLVNVPQPLDTAGFNRIKAQVEGFVNDPRPGLKVVFDFNPEGHKRQSGDYGVCYDLTKFLLGEKLQNVTTVAFVQADVTGHAVLPVLACKEIVMAPKGKLGPVVPRDGAGLEKSELSFYEEVARRRNYAPAVVLKMADRDVQLWQGQRGRDLAFVDRRRLADEVRDGFVAATGKPVPGVEAGQTQGYGAREAENLGLCKKQLESLDQLKEVYGKNLQEDPLQGRAPVAGRVRLTGPVTPGMKEGVQQSIRQAVANKTNLVFLILECHGGDTEAARQIAEFLSDLKDDEGKAPVKTVAYLTPEARDTATVIAFGCQDIVMHKDARLGQFDDLVRQRPNLAWAVSLQDLAKKRGTSPLLARGMLDPAVVIHLAQNKRDPNRTTLMEPEALQESQDWRNVRPVKAEGELLTLDAKQAADLGVARWTYDGDPANVIAWLQEKYAVPSIPEIPFGWLQSLRTFLRSPEVSYFLVIVGIAGLILELKIPGFGFPGVLAAVCFVLYFWSHSQQMDGSLTMLAVLLFVLGLILIGVEVFLLPGLGITGISGVILIVVSLGLVTLVKRPETTHEWLEFGRTLTTLGCCLVGAVGGAMLVAWYLPHIPWANRLVLTPPAGGAAGLAEEPRGTNYAALLGTVGEAATTLRPAGMARFGDAYLDVVAEGSYVEAGARVQIIEVEGNRIVVKEV